MKTIGLIYGNFSLGGIQRGASFQVPMFRSWGYRVVVMTVQPPDESDYAIPGIEARVTIGAATSEARGRIVEETVRAHGIGLVIHHVVYSHDDPMADLAGARRGGAKTVIFWHSVFSHFLLRKFRQREARALFEVCRSADAMITLTRTDEAFFRLLGVPSLAIPYSDPDMMEGFVRTAYPHRLVWMNRFIELKRPIDAMRIFARVLSRCPDAELFVLGEVKEAQYAADPREYVRTHPELAKAVHFEGFQKDVRPYLEKCGVGLVTSRFEGYCHSIVEMKMAGMPVVAYEMPYLDTLKPDSGAICVPQGDVEAATDAIIRLFGDPAEFARQGRKARASYFDIVSTDQKTAYTKLFDAVASGNLAELRTIEPQYARSVVRTFVEHMDWALELMDRTVREEWSRDRSYRLGRLVTWPYRMVKRILRGDRI